MRFDHHPEVIKKYCRLKDLSKKDTIRMTGGKWKSSPVNVRQMTEEELARMDINKPTTDKDNN